MFCGMSTSCPFNLVILAPFSSWLLLREPKSNMGVWMDLKIQSRIIAFLPSKSLENLNKVWNYLLCVFCLCCFSKHLDAVLGNFSLVTYKNGLQSSELQKLQNCLSFLTPFGRKLTTSFNQILDSYKLSWHVMLWLPHDTYSLFSLILATWNPGYSSLNVVLTGTMFSCQFK